MINTQYSATKEINNFIKDQLISSEIFIIAKRNEKSKNIDPKTPNNLRNVFL